MKPDQMNPIKESKQALIDYGHSTLIAQTGTGKTVVALSIYQELFEETMKRYGKPLHLLLIAPASLCILKDGRINANSPWDREFRKYNVYDEPGFNEGLENLSYETIRGTEAVKASAKSPIVVESFHTRTQNWQIEDENIVENFHWMYYDREEEDPEAFERDPNAPLDEVEIYGQDYGTGNVRSTIYDFGLDPPMPIGETYGLQQDSKGNPAFPPPFQLQPGAIEWLEDERYNKGGELALHNPGSGWYFNYDPGMEAENIRRTRPSDLKYAYSSHISPKTMIYRHGIKHSAEVKTDRGKSKVGEYTHSYNVNTCPTMELMNFMLKNHVMIICDEIHNAKNDSATNTALSAIIRAAKRANKMRSAGYMPDLGRNATPEELEENYQAYEDLKVAFEAETDPEEKLRLGIEITRFPFLDTYSCYTLAMTATPMDKVEQAGNYFRLFGYMDPIGNREMFFTNSPPRPIDMLNELVLYSEEAATEINNSYNVGIVISSFGEPLRFGSVGSVEASKEATYMIWLKLLQHIQTTMITLIFRQAFNCFFHIYDEEGKKYSYETREYLGLLAQAIAEKRLNDVFRLLSKIQELSEASLVRTMAVRIGRILYGGMEPTSKHLCAFVRVSAVDRMIECLTNLKGIQIEARRIGRVAGVGEEAKRAVEAMKGSAAKTRAEAQLKALKAQFKKEAAENVEIFQRPNNDMQIIVGILSRLNAGLDMHDIYGGFRRMSHVVGNYNNILIQQFLGRAARHNTQSVPICFIYYADDDAGSQTLKFYNNSVEKAKVLRSTMGASVRDVVPLDLPEEERLSRIRDIERQKILSKAFIKLPGEFDACVELFDETNGIEAVESNYSEEERIHSPEINEIYVMTRQMAKSDGSVDENGEPVLWPDANSFGFIEVNDTIGRQHFEDVNYLIGYLRKLYAEGYRYYPRGEDQDLNDTLELNYDKIDGLAILPLMAASANPYPNVVVPVYVPPGLVAVRGQINVNLGSSTASGRVRVNRAITSAPRTRTR